MINTQLNYMAILTGGGQQNDLFAHVNRKASIPSKTTHQALAKDQVSQRKEIADSSQIQRDMRAFREAVEKAGSLRDALADPTVHKIMSAIYEVDILAKSPDQFAKIMSTNPDDPNSLLGKTRDQGLIAMGKDFKKAKDALGLMRDSAYQEAIQNTLVSLEFERKAGRTSPQAANAFYFERKAAEISGPMDILANPRLRDVVFGALGLPDQLKGRPVAEQAVKLAGALDFNDFQDGSKMRDMAVKYLNAADRQQTLADPALSILSSSGLSGNLVNILS